MEDMLVPRDVGPRSVRAHRSAPGNPDPGGRVSAAFSPARLDDSVKIPQDRRVAFVKTLEHQHQPCRDDASAHVETGPTILATSGASFPKSDRRCTKQPLPVTGARGDPPMLNQSHGPDGLEPGPSGSHARARSCPPLPPAPALVSKPVRDVEMELKEELDRFVQAILKEYARLFSRPGSEVGVKSPRR